MQHYTTNARGQSTGFNRELGLLLGENSNADPVALLRPVLGDVVDTMRRAIRCVRLGDLKRGRVQFRPDAFRQTPARAQMERRFFGLMLIILGELRGEQSRAWTKQLWRGRRETCRVSPDGEWQRVYFRNRRKDGTTGAQGGLAARVGVCVREVDRYLQIAKAAGLVSVWQGPTRERAKKHFEGGKKYAFAVFQWAAELSHAVRDRIRGRVSAMDRAEGPAPRASASAPPAPASAEETDGLNFGAIAAALRTRPAPPS